MATDISDSPLAGARACRRGVVRHFLAVGLAAIGVTLALPATAASQSDTPVAWSTAWTPALFAQAALEHRYVLLDLHAVWCHWCHVMDEQTYADAAVRVLLAEHYVAVSVDADSDPGLASRYGDWGWPATIVLAADGTEIAKRRGYIPADQMVALLTAVVADPSPGPSVTRAPVARSSGASALGSELRHDLLADVDAAYDGEHGGWGTVHKYLEASIIDLEIARLEDGDATAERRIRQALDANLTLIDPVWGGVYQYADEVDWRSPHYEKLMSYQADDLRLYSEAYARWQDPRYLAAAAAIRRYIGGFLTAPGGAFYVSQDADLSVRTPGTAYFGLDNLARRELGVPRVDTHIYARESGWAIRALCRYSDITGDAAALADAERAAVWVLAQRALGGGFRHDEADRDGPFLDDSVAMGEAFVALYRSTSERRWLASAEATLRFIGASFSDPAGGFIAAPAPGEAVGVFRDPVRAVDQNAALARLANFVFRYTGQTEYRELARYAMRLLAAGSAGQGGWHADVLLADAELATTPTHITVVGAKSDPAAQALHATALKFPVPYLQIDWWDRAEGPLPNPAIGYPQLPTAAAFACSETTCSTPVYDAERLRHVVDALRADR